MYINFLAGFLIDHLLYIFEYKCKSINYFLYTYIFTLYVHLFYVCELLLLNLLHWPKTYFQYHNQ